MRQGNAATLLFPASLPLFVLAAAMIVLYFRAPPGSHEAPGLLLWLNVSLTTLVSVFIAILAGRSFLASGRPALLATCVGMIVWGVSAFVAVIGEHVGNYNLTIHNLGVAVSGICHLFGGFVALRFGERSVRDPGAWLALGVAAGLCAVGAIWMGTLESWLPPFFVEGVGATGLRTAVLSGSIGMFAAAAGLTWTRYRVSGWRFLFWYSLGLAFIAAGAAGLILQPTHGSWLGWVARVTQYLGGVYMLAGTVITMRESGGWAFSLEERLLRSEQVQREQADLIRTINDSTNELIFMKDRRGVLTYANAATLRLLGRASLTNGASDREYFHLPAEHAAVSENDRRVMETGQVVEAEENFTGADGRQRTFLSTKSPLRDQAGLIVGVIAVSRDITDAKRAERTLRESEEQFRRLADAMPQIVYVSRPDGSVEYLNRQWAEYTGSDGMDLPTVVHPDDQTAVLQAWEEAGTAGKPMVAELRLRRSDGAYRWFLTRAVPIRDADGAVGRWFGTSTDIHDRREAEEALREADRRKDRFLATLAHELRNPLAPMRTGLELLKTSEAGDETLDNVHSMMERQIGQMVRLIDDLMDVSRINTGKLRLQTERMELTAVLQSAAEQVRPAIEAAAHELTLALPTQPIFLHGDPTRLTQVFANLLANAAKYTGRGGRIGLSAELNAGTAIVRVRDNGIGIPADKLGGLFGMFVQVEETLERSRGGLGVGLWLVKSLVELHGGSVQARSDGPGKGSEFVVSLPSGTSAAPAAPLPAPGLAPPYAKRRILVVDDNIDGARMLATTLRLDGHDVRQIHDGEAAETAAEQFRPDAVLLDIGLPGKSGYEVARSIRLSGWGAGTVLIALTGWGQDEDRRQSRDAGFDHHLVKPVDIRMLKSLLNEIFLGRRTAAAAYPNSGVDRG